ncbi:MAG: hypothetical protein PHU85_13185 [Phycisphaerae bacterium]|nr:hypothetical protein [Phycisphaerae bacterium]
MMKKVWDTVAIIAVANLLALVTLAILLAASGSLKGERLKLARDALAGRPLPVVRVVEQAKELDPTSLTSAGQLITKEQANTQIVQLQIDQQMRELKDFQLQLDQARSALDARISQFEQERKAWIAQRDAERALLASEGFRKSLSLYESIPADQAKDLFMSMEDTEVVRMLSAMEERKASKIAKAFASEAEKNRLKKILDRLERPGTTQPDSPKRTGTP